MNINCSWNPKPIWILSIGSEVSKTSEQHMEKPLLSSRGCNKNFGGYRDRQWIGGKGKNFVVSKWRR
jgi:hypothetical protein